MRGLVCWATLAGGLWLLPSAAWAQCTKDTDCKGERICEDGKCAYPKPPAAASGAAAELATPPEAPVDPALEAPAAPAPAPAAPAPAPALPPAAEPPVASSPPAALAPLGEDEPALRRRSKAAMSAGIVMVSIAPIALLGAVVARNNQAECDDALQNQYPGHILPTSERYRAERCDGYSVPIYVLGIGGALLGVAGIPLIVYGAPRVPAEKAAQVSLAPWGSASSGGVRLSLSL